MEIATMSGTSWAGRLLRLVVAALCACAPLGVAWAARQDVFLFTDRDIGEALAARVQDFAADMAQTQAQPFVIGAACRASIGLVPRFAVLARVPTDAQLERCAQNANADVKVLVVGYQALAFVVPSNAPVWSVDAAVLFRAFGQNGGDPSRPPNWSSIDRNYPDQPIGLLLPAPGSRAQRLFDAFVMDLGCERVVGAHVPIDRADGMEFCAALRSDIPIARRDGGVDDVAKWAASAPPGAVAVVNTAELAQLGRRVVPLLLDGMLPTGENIDSGRYPVAEKVALLIVVPRATDQVRRNVARGVAFRLLSEASIGPAGQLPSAGLMPLPPAERVTLRAQADEFVGLH